MTQRRLTLPRHPITRPKAIPFPKVDQLSNTAPSSHITPQTIKSAYAFPQKPDLSVIKVACIEAFYNDSLQPDTEVFCKHYGIEYPNLQILYPFGKSRFTNSAWIYESALDVQWLCALCGRIQLHAVFSPTDELEYLMRCALYASDTLNCDIVLMSFGTSEFLSQSEISQSLRERQNTIFVAASGDTGGKVFFPSSAGSVLSVGGSTVAFGSDGLRLGNERAWRFGGGGASKYESIPPYQLIFDNINKISGGFRATPDVCFYSDFSPGVPIYTSSDTLKTKGWNSSGGTSFASVAFASICTYIKAAAPKSFQNNINSYLYTLAGGTKYDTPQYYFNDITHGSNNVYSAKAGWDFCTGLGSPIVNQLISG